MAIVGRFGPASRAVLAIIALSLGAGTLFVLYRAFTLPLAHPPAETPRAATLFEAGSGVPFAARGVQHGEVLAADHLPADLAHAVVAIEDRRFFSHHGIDPRGISRAAWHDVAGSGPVGGGSTITQQLARLAYLSPERTLRRTMQEVIPAFWVEARASPKRIPARSLHHA